jgi:amino acid transporter
MHGAVGDLMQALYEIVLYVSISAGMALTTSCFSMIASMFGMASAVSILVSIVVAGLVCILISTSIAELASMYPSAPGVRTYLKMAFGDYTSLTLVSLYLMMAATIGGIEAYVLSLIVADMGLHIPPLVVGVGTVSAVLALNLLGIEIPRMGQLLMTAMLVLGILAIAGAPMLGAPIAPDAPAAAAAPGRPGDAADFFSAVAIGIFLFMGFEWVTPSGRGPHAYRWMIPLSMPIAILLLGALYLGFSLAIGGYLSRSEVVENAIPQLALGRLVLGQWGYYLMAFLTLLTALASFNAGIMGASRLVHALAREGSLPRWCARRHSVSGAPVGAIALIGIIALAATVIIIESRSYVVASIVGAAIECVVYGALVFAVLRLRVLEAAAPRPYRSPLPVFAQGAMGVAMPVLGIFALIDSEPQGAVVFVVLTAASLVVAAFMRAQYDRRSAALR